MQKLEKHVDGTWWTTRLSYLGYDLIIKMQQGKGAKVHIMKQGEKTKTFRYNFANDYFLTQKAKEWVNQKLKPTE